MQLQSDICENAVGMFAKEYLEKLFYFCLKKTGNTSEAEDLAQDIALHVISALRGGTEPISFSAWVWQIARNRYSVWADTKHRRSESHSRLDIGDHVIEDGESSVLDDMIRAEELSLLRRELAFIRSDFRGILIAYYHKCRSIRDIAASLSLTESAVQQRLHRARIKLKEGMEMAREFGKKSYDPENIRFAASGPQPSGLPWNAVQRMIPQNILLHASNNPSTLEELSVELGIALPYMEEETALLVNSTLLEKQGDRFITNFFILESDCRREVYNALRDTSQARSRLIGRITDEKLSDVISLGIAEKHISDMDVKWWLTAFLIDLMIENTVKGEDVYEPPKRANGETWGFVGYELTELPEDTFMSHDGSGCKGNNLWRYSFGDCFDGRSLEIPDYDETLFLCNCIRNKRSISTFSDIERLMWRRLDGRYAHTDGDGIVIPDILVIKTDALEKIRGMCMTHDIVGELMQNVNDAYDRLEEIFKRYSHRVLHDNLGYYIRMELYAIRMMSIHDLVGDGVLTIPDDIKNSNIGMHLILD